MYKLLIVDDEPLICQGLGSLLKKAGLHIQDVFTAHNGYEALDYLRMEDIHLMITDIQMDSISGIELMHQAKIMKPWVQTLVISAHEDFHYAQRAIRLGAKDYLIKPLDSGHFLDAVRNILLKMNQTAPPADEFIATLREDFAWKQPQPHSKALLKDVLAVKQDTFSLRNDLHRLREQYRISLEGPFFSIMKVKLLLDSEESRNQPISPADAPLFVYAALNIIHESLAQEWNHVSFDSAEQEITVILQWSEEEYAEGGVNKIGQLEMIGRSLEHNIRKHILLPCLIGISQIMQGAEFLPDLHAQAQKAISWNVELHDNHVFYYGDFNWSWHDNEPTADDLHEQNNSMVSQVKQYIHRHYSEKGLTLNRIAQENHISPNYLSYLFKKYMNCNLWEYVIQLRMEESKRLLLHTDLRRYEIAERVGYESPEHFSKIFKKYFGKSPSEMKK